MESRDISIAWSWIRLCQIYSTFSVHYTRRLRRLSTARFSGYFKNSLHNRGFIQKTHPRSMIGRRFIQCFNGDLRRHTFLKDSFCSTFIYFAEMTDTKQIIEHDFPSRYFPFVVTWTKNGDYLHNMILLRSVFQTRFKNLCHFTFRRFEIFRVDGGKQQLPMIPRIRVEVPNRQE